MAFATEKPVALGGALCPEVLVLLFVAPLLYAKGAAVPCARFWWDGAMALITMMFRPVVRRLARSSHSVRWHLFLSGGAVLAGARQLSCCSALFGFRFGGRYCFGVVRCCIWDACNRASQANFSLLCSVSDAGFCAGVERNDRARAAWGFCGVRAIERAGGAGGLGGVLPIGIRMLGRVVAEGKPSAKGTPAKAAGGL